MNIKARFEENFKIVNFWVIQKCALDIRKAGHCK